MVVISVAIKMSEWEGFLAIKEGDCQPPHLQGSLLIGSLIL